METPLDQAIKRRKVLEQNLADINALIELLEKDLDMNKLVYLIAKCNIFIP